MSFWQENKIPLSILLGASLVAAALYFGLTQRPPSFLTKTESQISPSPLPSLSPSPLPFPSPTPTPLPSPTGTTYPSPPVTPAPEITWKKSDIIAALSKKTGIPEDKISFTIGEQIKGENKILLRGGVSHKDEIGGAGFFAVVDKDGVKVTFAGQGVPYCSEVNPYGYPISWADYCVDEAGNTVPR